MANKVGREAHQTIDTFKGVNLTDPNHVIDDREFESVENLIISDTGDLIRRKPLRYFAEFPVAQNNVNMLGIFYNRLLFSTEDSVFLGPVDTDFSNSYVEVGVAGADAATAVLYNKNIYFWSDASSPSLTVTTVSDWTIDNPTFGSGTITGTPPTIIAKSVIFKDRCFAIKDPAEQSNRVFYSEIADPGNWQANNFFDVIPGDGDVITDIIPFGERLFVFKKRSTYIIILSPDPSSWITKLFDAQIGAVCPFNAIEYRGLLYVMSARGLYRSDGTIYDYVGYPVQTRWEAEGPNIAAAIQNPYTTFMCMVDDYIFVNSGVEAIGRWFYNPVQNAWTECVFPSGQIATHSELRQGYQGYLKNGARGTWFGWVKGTPVNLLWFGLGDPDMPTNEDYSDYVFHHATPGSRVITPIHTEFKTKMWDNGAFYRGKRHKLSTIEMKVPEQNVVEDPAFTTFHNFNREGTTPDYEFSMSLEDRGTWAQPIPGTGHARRFQMCFESDCISNYTVTGYDLTYILRRGISNEVE
jgi:hypothetical protein